MTTPETKITPLTERLDYLISKSGVLSEEALKTGTDKLFYDVSPNFIDATLEQTKILATLIEFIELRNKEPVDAKGAALRKLFERAKKNAF